MAATVGTRFKARGLTKNGFGFFRINKIKKVYKKQTGL